MIKVGIANPDQQVCVVEKGLLSVLKPFFAQLLIIPSVYLLVEGVVLNPKLAFILKSTLKLLCKI